MGEAKEKIVGILSGIRGLVQLRDCMYKRLKMLDLQAVDAKHGKHESCRD